jgi:hypothetical protein
MTFFPTMIEDSTEIMHICYYSIFMSCHIVTDLHRFSLMHLYVDEPSAIKINNDASF